MMEKQNAKTKNEMPKKIKSKCQKVIHAAAIAAAGAAAIPIPIADAIPITAAQVAMIAALGKVFNVTISKSAAKAIAGCGIAQSVGRTIAGGVLKAIPVVRIAGIVISATVATSITEGLGWIIADDFYRMSIGEEPENFFDKMDDIDIDKFKDLFKKSSKSKKLTKSGKAIKKKNN